MCRLPGRQSAPLAGSRERVFGNWARSDFLFELSRVPFDDHGELRELERLLYKIGGSRFGRLARGGPVPERSHHDDAHVLPRIAVLHLPADLPPIPARHHHIEEDERRFLFFEELEGLVTVVGNGDGIATRLEVIADDVRIVLVVVHYEDRRERAVGHILRWL